jgi:hypothetical protein
MKHIVKYPPNNQLIYLVALVLLLAALIGLQSCSSEKKALKPYKAVNSDVDTSYKEKKIELISRVCAVNFPIQEKTIVKDSITTKIVRIQDNNLVNKLKAELAKKCKDINIDSIYNLLPFDTIYIDHYHTKTVTQKDTLSLYNMGVENTRLVYYNQQLKSIIDDNNKDIKDITADNVAAKKDRNKWRLYFFFLLSACIVYKVAKIYLSKSFTLPKIF